MRRQYHHRDSYNYPHEYRPDYRPQYYPPQPAKRRKQKTHDTQSWHVFALLALIASMLALVFLLPGNIDASPEKTQAIAPAAIFDAQPATPSADELAEQITALKKQHGLKLFKSGKCKGDGALCAELLELVKQWEGAK